MTSARRGFTIRSLNGNDTYRLGSRPAAGPAGAGLTPAAYGSAELRPAPYSPAATTPSWHRGTQRRLPFRRPARHPGTARTERLRQDDAMERGGRGVFVYGTLMPGELRWQ